MKDYFKVIVTTNGKKKIFDYFTDKLNAIGFAGGYAQCIADFGTILESPQVPSVDGFQWWSRKSAFNENSRSDWFVSRWQF